MSGGQVVGFNVTNHGAGYTAAPTVTITDGTGTGAVAAASSGLVPGSDHGSLWSRGQASQINLTNNLSFTPAAAGKPNIPTSIVIVGQVGGGLGGTPTSHGPSPSHSNAQGCPSWFIASSPPGTPCTAPTAGVFGPHRRPRGRACNPWARKWRRLRREQPPLNLTDVGSA